MKEIIKNDCLSIIKEKINWKLLQNKTVLVAGSTGLIGSYVVYVLDQLNKNFNANINIVASCRNVEKANSMFFDCSGINIIKHDILNKLSYDGELDFIINAASPASPEYFESNPVGTNLANTLGSYYFLELAREKNAKYMFISTMEVYGNLGDDIYDIDETKYGAIDSLNKRSCYHLSKKNAENLVCLYNIQYGMDNKIIRPAHTYGPGMDINSARVQCEFIRKALDNEDIVIKSDGKMLRTYTYISDVISGLFYVLLNSNDIVYNIVNNESTVSIKGLAESVIIASGNSSNVIFQKGNLAGCATEKSKILSSDKLKNLGWNPKIDINDGILRTFNYYKQYKNIIQDEVTVKYEKKM